ncbi:splicing factor 3B subunit 2-like [Ruditapes philippinarum]|uniref:splicing factor 3B subunit 2-like n=1 Tax=Ruditapes philippinarum TaxID=129788 RepID=UPI00295C3632|nr:splicing factor 3B subunit 2-like [Ruditapes philippinarum]
MDTGGQFSPPPQVSQGPPSGPPSLMTIPVQEPQQKAKAPPPPGPAHVTRTSLQMRLQQMAGQSSDENSSSQGQSPSQPSTQPPPLMAQQVPPPQISQPSTQPPPLMSQQVQPPKPQMNQPPSLMSQQVPPPNPPQMGQPPQLMQQQPPGMGLQQGQPPQMGQPPQQMMSPPPLGPPPQMSQPPPLGPPPQNMGKPPQIGPPPHAMGGPPPLAPPGTQIGQPVQPPPPGQMLPQVGQPPGQMGQPPQLVQSSQMGQQQPLQDIDLQEKIAMQTRLIEQERQQEQHRLREQQEQQRMREQQQKERLAIQKQAILLQQQHQPQPPAPGAEEGTDLMEKVRQQQIMLEQQKQKERMEQQQQALLEQQNQAIKKQEEERRRNEAELIRQQQIALMEAKREEQQKRIREERRGPPTTGENEQQRPAPIPANQPFNPRPSLLHGPGPRPLLPTSSPSGIPPLMPPRTSASIPPLMPPSSSSEQIRPPRPPEERMDRAPQEPRELKLPSALEKVLAFKDVRAQEVGLTPEELEQLNMPEKKPVEDEDDDEIEMVEMEEEDANDDNDEVTRPDPARESKNKKKKKKKKKAKQNRKLKQTEKPIEPQQQDEPDVQVEYVQEQLDLDPTDPNYFIFSKIFETFKITDESGRDQPQVVESLPEKASEPKAKMHDPDNDDSDEEMDDKLEDDGPKLSKKKLKKLTRLSVAQLKQLVTRPDVVEMHDVTAQDPRLLVHLKATRNTVAVPRHWCFKRKYLQGKRGIEKAPFELPDYIQATGITEMRAALAEKEDQKNLKSKMREKVRPKMGKIDIDYQKLHDAFFRWQTKPKMTIHGDLYYEGKEFETRLKEKKPGNLSDDLKTALGMPIGPQSEKVPPPWLIAMQRYGPPPSYPNLKIPGLTGPIPEGCSFGYHAGGWGKPPVDENGKPLYGDVFGTKSSDFEAAVKDDDIDRSKWGELESESESEEESEEESDEETPEDSGLITPAEGLVTPSGITSVPVGMETPDMIELRKKRIEDSMDQGGETPALYQVIPEKRTNVGAAMMGSAHIYDVAGVPAGAKKPGEKVSTEGIEVALNPEELDLDTAAMQAKYDQTLREQQSQLEKEDLSDMVAEHAAKQKKRKKKQEESGKAAKKYKEFKF